MAVLNRILLIIICFTLEISVEKVLTMNFKVKGGVHKDLLTKQTPNVPNSRVSALFNPK